MDLCHLSSAPTDLRLKLTPAAQGIPGLTQALCDVIAGNVAVESMTIAGAPMRRVLKSKSYGNSHHMPNFTNTYWLVTNTHH